MTNHVTSGILLLIFINSQHSGIKSNDLKCLEFEKSSRSLQTHHPFIARPGWRPLRVTRPTLNLSFALFLVIFSLPQQPRLWWLHCSTEHHLARPGNKTAVPRAPPLLPPGAARPPCQHLFPPWGALAPLLLVQSAAAQVKARLPETTSSLSFTLQGWWSQSKGRKRRRESQNDRHNVIASRVLSDPGPIIVYPSH